MAERKTRKLACIVTGRVLIATREYYQRKIEKAGGEEKLQRTYICREAKNLIRKGLSIDKIREMLNVDTTGLPEVPQDIINSLLNTSKTNFRRINNFVSISNMINSKTDDDVKKFINKSFEQEYEKLIIITGKGLRSKAHEDPYRSEKMSVLKFSIPEYIKSDKDLSSKISKVSQAEVKDGGEGAIYIFLKKNNNL